MDKTEEEKMIIGFNELIGRRGITDREGYFAYLIDQKRMKLDKSTSRAVEAAHEIRVLQKMIRGEL